MTKTNRKLPDGKCPIYFLLIPAIYAEILKS